jgi:hypothetical protein
MFTSVLAYEKLLKLRTIKSSYEEREDNAKCCVFSVFFVKNGGEGFFRIFFLTNEQNMLPKLMPQTILYNTVTAHAAEFRFCSASTVL